MAATGYLPVFALLVGTSVGKLFQRSWGTVHANRGRLRLDVDGSAPREVIAEIHMVTNATTGTGSRFRSRSPQKRFQVWTGL